MIKVLHGQMEQVTQEIRREVNSLERYIAEAENVAYGLKYLQGMGEIRAQLSRNKKIMEDERRRLFRMMLTLNECTACYQQAENNLLSCCEQVLRH